MGKFGKVTWSASPREDRREGCSEDSYGPRSFRPSPSPPPPHSPLSSPGRVEVAPAEAPSPVLMATAVTETTGWGRSGLWPAVRKWTLCAERGKRGSCCSLRPPSQHHEKDAPRRCRYHALLPRPGRQRRANQLWVLVLPPRRHRRWSPWRQVPLSPLVARTGRTGLPKTRYLDPG